MIFRYGFWLAMGLLLTIGSGNVVASVIDGRHGGEPIDSHADDAPHADRGQDNVRPGDAT